jgi:uracil-DNA glycosylase family 4
MPKGFFSTSEIAQSATKQSRIPKCGLCGRKNKKSMALPDVRGKGKEGIMIVSPVPSNRQMNAKYPLADGSGMLIKSMLQANHISPKQDCWFLDAVHCGGKKITKDHIISCRPKVIKAITERKPRLLILLGEISVKSVLPWVWKDTLLHMSRWFGYQIPCQEPNMWICPTYHPFDFLDLKNADQYRLQMKKHFHAALQLKDHPWKKHPHFEQRVQLIWSSSVACKKIKDIIDTGDPFAFDYETNCLKPEYPESEIVSCSICRKGGETFAFMWDTEVAAMMKCLLQTPNAKIAANLKFEDRWTRNKLGVAVRNWVWDTMIAAHILDSRKLVTSLKFQSFAQLGQAPYDDHIEPLLRSSQGYYNRIREIEPKELLIYNGMDSLLEWKLANKQKRFMEG